MQQEFKPENLLRIQVKSLETEGLSEDEATRQVLEKHFDERGLSHIGDYIRDEASNR